MFRAQWMFELAPGVGSSSLETRSCRAARGSFLKAGETKGKQELAKEEKLSIMGIVLAQILTNIPVYPSLTTSRYFMMSPLLMGFCPAGALSSWNCLW